LLVVQPTEHILRGFAIETTTEKDRIYLWRVVMPLYRPWRYVILDYSDRIFLKSGADIYLADTYKESASLICSLISDHKRYLQDIRRPEDFLRHVGRMIGNDTINFRFTLALTYFRIGKVRECREILQALDVDVAQRDRTYFVKHGIKTHTDDQIKRAMREIGENPQEFARLLDRWEADNLRTLGLQASRL